MTKLTRKAIQSSFLELLRTKSLDKITIKDLVERCEINRNTFYISFFLTVYKREIIDYDKRKMDQRKIVRNIVKIIWRNGI